MAEEIMNVGEGNQRRDPGEEPSGGPDHQDATMTAPTSSSMLITSFKDSRTVAWPAALFVTSFLIGPLVVVAWPGVTAPLWSPGGARPQSV